MVWKYARNEELTEHLINRERVGSVLNISLNAVGSLQKSTCQALRAVSCISSCLNSPARLRHIAIIWFTECV
jgi:hypothetical protein